MNEVEFNILILYLKMISINCIECHFFWLCFTFWYFLASLYFAMHSVFSIFIHCVNKYHSNICWHIWFNWLLIVSRNNNIYCIRKKKSDIKLNIQLINLKKSFVCDILTSMNLLLSRFIWTFPCYSIRNEPPWTSC